MVSYLHVWSLIDHERKPVVNSPKRWISVWLLGLLAAGGVMGAQEAQQQAPHRLLVNQYCTTCHNDRLKTAELALDQLLANPLEDHAETWEKVVRKLRARQMPPVGRPRPDETTYDAVVASLETALDRAAEAHPDPGRTDTFRRLTRTEYRNAIRDLLVLDLDLSDLLPRDESSQGFDNITVTDLSPTLLERYVAAADKISRLAVGRPVSSPAVETVKMKPDLTQEWHVEGLPVGTRGGTLMNYAFPLDGDYEFVIRLTRDRDEQVEGLREPHQVELLLDRERVRLFTVAPPRHIGDHSDVDAHLKVRLPVTAGPHAIGVTFLKQPWAVLETDRMPYDVHFNVYRHPRVQPGVYEISISGPFDATGPGDTPSRKRIFVCRPTVEQEEEACAGQIVDTLMRRAYRRPVTERDRDEALEFYRQGRPEGFEAGIEMALSSILISPEFLFRVERDPAGIAPETPYRISDLELASRLSFFLWSSIPDDELLDLATEGRLSQPAVLEQQVTRMLADERSRTLLTNFVGQWLHLRNLESATPDIWAALHDDLETARLLVKW